MAKALDRIEEIDATITTMMDEYGINDLVDEKKDLDKKVREFVLAKDSMEVPNYKLTVVRGFMRKWDGEKLAKLVPKGILLKVVDYVPNADKIDELVKAGKLDAKKIKSAYIETPKQPYVKITKVKEQDSSEADRVAEALA